MDGQWADVDENVLEHMYWRRKHEPIGPCCPWPRLGRVRDELVVLKY